MASSKTAAQIIDEVRDAYSRRLIDRPTAIGRITSLGLSLTDEGKADLLDHEMDAAERYASQRR